MIVHDGANLVTEQLVGRFQAEDPRIEYLNTPTRGNDFGVTPRLEALRARCSTILRIMPSSGTTTIFL